MKACVDFVIVFVLVIVPIALCSLSTHDNNVIICGSVVIVMVFSGMVMNWRSNRPVKVKYRQETKVSYKEKAKIGEDGELISPVSSEFLSSRFSFSGRGTNITDVVYLQQGLYSIEYRLSSPGSTVIELVSVDNPGENQNILKESASGSRTFRVIDSGHYLFQIKSPDGNATWAIKCASLM